MDMIIIKIALLCMEYYMCTLINDNVIRGVTGQNRHTKKVSTVKILSYSNLLTK